MPKLSPYEGRPHLSLARSRRDPTHRELYSGGKRELLFRPNDPRRGREEPRNKLIHHYFGVNLQLVWDVVERDLPALKQKIGRLLEALGEKP